MGVRKFIIVFIISIMLISCSGEEEINEYNIAISSGNLIISNSKVKSGIRIIRIEMYYKDGKQVFTIGKEDVKIKNGRAVIGLLDIFKKETYNSRIFLPFVSNREYYMTIEYADRIFEEITFFVGNPIREKSIDLLKESENLKSDIRVLLLEVIRFRMNY
ncbi:hypothetical protein WKV44_10465 [Spirochaetia bacterium 38H-sp]|uniref:Lipoprotein n=1 Tax=Rarispira pelagica TaxID=3141764 RepID=A0ABU9UE60_9SPIR